MIHVAFFACMYVFLWSIFMDIVQDEELMRVFHTKSKGKNFLRILLWPIVSFMFYRKKR